MRGKGGGHRDGLRAVEAVASFLSRSVLIGGVLIGGVVVGGVVVGGVVVGCEDAREARGGTATQPASVPGQTEQVVHRIAPSPAQSATASASAPANGPILNGPASLTRAPSTGDSSRPVDGITSKHLEAELNRLEAELED